MVPYTTKYTLSIFDMEHNHELDRFEYKHLSKSERKLTYAEQLFIIKASNANIGAVRAHNLYTGDSDAQMIITQMEERKQYIKDFSFDYFIEDVELIKLQSATIKSLVETTVAYGWLLRAFRKAFVRVPNIVVTDQDEAMRLAVAVEFCESKHKLCMWHIMQKIPSKIVSRIYDEIDFKAKFGTKNRYGEKNEAIERLAIKASLIVDSYVHMLSTNEPKLTSFINKIKALKAKVEADFPIVPSCTVFELVQEFMGVKKSDKVNVKNPLGVKTKRHEKEKHIKGGREISMENQVVSGGGDHGDGGSRDDGPRSVSV
nr:hypothetical protein [Tanacetum cinerariifolium]